MKMKKTTRKNEKKKIPYAERMSNSSAIDSGGAWDARAPPQLEIQKTKPTMLPITPARTPRISRLKSQILKSTFLS